MNEVNALNAYELLNIPVTATKDEIRAAYRNMARRWHPDRFMAGPERDWANEKMADINAAYRQCLKGAGENRIAPDDEDAALKDVQRLIDLGQYQSARKLLMGFDTRCAEWNYLFGATLLRLCDTQKALIYLSVAAHQNPNNIKYAQALREAQQSGTTTRRLMGLFARKRQD